MINRKREVVAIVPARANSKSIKNKNMLLLKGKPVLFWTLDLVKTALEEGIIDRAIFTTESKEYRASVVGHYRRHKEMMGKMSIILRDPSLSRDWVQNDDVVMDVIRRMDGFLNEGAIGVLLQPTSPFRKYEHLAQAIEQKCFGEWEKTVISGHMLDTRGFIWSVRDDFHDMKPMGHDPTRRLGRQWDSGYEEQRIFKEDGSIYVFDWDVAKHTRTFRNPPFMPLITEPVVDLDEPEDWERAKKDERAG